MKSKKFLACLLTVLMLVTIASCKKATDDNNNNNNNNGNNNNPNTPTEKSWFTNEQLTGFGAQGLTLPSDSTIYEINSTKAVFSPMTQDTYKTFVYDVYNKLKTNNTDVYTLNANEANTFEKANITSNMINAEDYTLFYNVGDKFYSVTSSLAAQGINGSPANSAVLEFKDVTANYTDPIFR